MIEITRILGALNSACGQPAALATLVRIEGSSYRRPGARLLLLPNGTRVGSVSGGCLDQDVVERAKQVLNTGQPQLAVYDTTEENDLVWGVGLGCQGIVHVFLELIPAERPAWVSALYTNQSHRRDTVLEVNFDNVGSLGTHLLIEPAPDSTGFRETIPAPPALSICGAGDDAQPLARMAKEMGWQVTVADTRPAYATAQRFPESDHLLVGPVAEIIGERLLDARTFIVVMTHRFEDDLAFLRASLSMDFAYLGQLGPRKRTERLLKQLRMDGVVPDASILAKLHAPVGLDLGGNSPETVALAILAEMQTCLAGRKPGHLRDRAGPIHA